MIDKNPSFAEKTVKLRAMDYSKEEIAEELNCSRSKVDQALSEMNTAERILGNLDNMIQNVLNKREE